MREKTVGGAAEHITNYKNETTVFFGDSHVERLIWKYPFLTPQNTWLCGIGGDRISQLLWRISNEEQSGYTQSSIQGIKRAVIMIGSNDIPPDMRKSDAKVSKMIQQVELIVVKVKQKWPDAVVQVVQIPPIPTRGRDERSQEFVELYNDLLKGLDVKVFEWPEMDLEKDFIDHVHLTISGYRKFLNMVREG